LIVGRALHRRIVDVDDSDRYVGPDVGKAMASAQIFWVRSSTVPPAAPQLGFMDEQGGLDQRSTGL
jgi:hypothetical protein